MQFLTAIIGQPLFSIGDTQTTVGSLLAVVAVVAVTLLTGRIVRKSVSRLLRTFGARADDGATKAYGIVAQLLIYFIGLEIALHLLGLQLSTLFAATGFLALGAGFAVKNVVENFLSGGILRAENTIRPGDLIIVQGEWMFVKRIGARTVVALTYAGEQVLIPNSLVAQSVVTNLTRHDRLHRIALKVGVAYDSDLALVRKTLEDTVRNLDWRSRLKDPCVYLAAFGDSSVNFDVDVWIDDANDSRGRRSDLHEAVWRALQESGITIAFPQLDVHLDGDVVDKEKKR